MVYASFCYGKKLSEVAIANAMLVKYIHGGSKGRAIAPKSRKNMTPRIGSDRESCFNTAQKLGN
jgi:hypothetical protein